MTNNHTGLFEELREVLLVSERKLRLIGEIYDGDKESRKYAVLAKQAFEKLDAFMAAVPEDLSDSLLISGAITYVTNNGKQKEGHLEKVGRAAKLLHEAMEKTNDG